MPTVNDEFNRTCVRLDLDPERSGIFTPAEVTFSIAEADLAAFNAAAARVAPGAPPFNAEQIVGAARRLARAVGRGNESRFIQIRMRRAGEVRVLLNDRDWVASAHLVGRMRDLLAYLDGPVALVPMDVPAVGGLDRALLMDLALEALRAELDEYADFCRYRAGEAERRGVPVESIGLDRGQWAEERSEELRLERLVRRMRSVGFAPSGAPADVFRVS